MRRPNVKVYDDTRKSIREISRRLSEISLRKTAELLRNGLIYPLFVSIDWDAAESISPHLAEELRQAYIQALERALQFQSHNGAIAASVTKNLKSLKNEFQSHNGAIAARVLPAVFLNGLRFNPTMVRLLLIFLGVFSRSSCGFNPTMVRLLLISVDLLDVMLNVSIPQWCDCCFWEGIKSLARKPGFNPTMVRLLPADNNPQLKGDIVSIPQWCDCCRYGGGR